MIGPDVERLDSLPCQVSIVFICSLICGKFSAHTSLTCFINYKVFEIELSNTITNFISVEEDWAHKTQLSGTVCYRVFREIGQG